jgi:hypothetical protein
VWKVCAGRGERGRKVDAGREFGGGCMVGGGVIDFGVSFWGVLEAINQT